VPSREAQDALIDYLQFKVGRQIACPSFRPDNSLFDWASVHGLPHTDTTSYQSAEYVALCERLLVVQRLFSMPRSAQNRLGVGVAYEALALALDMKDPRMCRDLYEAFVLPYLDLAPTALTDAGNYFDLAEDAYRALRDGGDPPTAASVMQWVLRHTTVNKARQWAEADLKETLDAIRAGAQATATNAGDGGDGGGTPTTSEGDALVSPLDLSGPFAGPPEKDSLRSYASPPDLAGGTLLYSQYVPKGGNFGDFQMGLVTRSTKENPHQPGTCATCYVEGDGQLLDPKLLPDGKHVLAKYGEYPDPVKLSPFRYYILDLVKHTWTPGAPVTLS
jgi:hypothetical protein